MNLRRLVIAMVLGALWCAPAALAGAPATTFSAAGTATRPDLGPCALSVAGSLSGSTVQGEGHFAAAARAQSPAGNTCNGGPASLAYDVTAASITGTTAVLTVKVTASDDPSTPVGTVGTITAVQIVGGNLISFAIGPHSGGFSNAPGHVTGFIDTWADVRVDNHADAARITAFDGVGTAIDLTGGFGPCVVAVAGTRTEQTAGGAPTNRGGGSFQSQQGTPPPPENLNTPTCNGLPAEFGYTLADVTADGSDSTELGLVVSESANPTLPVGLPGTIGIYDSNPPTQKVNVAFGSRSGGFGPGRNVFHGFIDERAGAGYSVRTLGTSASTTPSGGFAVTTFGAAGTSTSNVAGPCGLSVGGSVADLAVAGRGSFVASGLPPAMNGSSVCAGGPATLRFDVVTAFQQGSTIQLGVEVTQSDDVSGGTPVGSAGVITIVGGSNPSISFAIGSHTGSFSNSTSGGTVSYASAEIADRVGAASVLSFDGAGATTDGAGNQGPCIAAAGGTKVVFADGTSLVSGGGSYQAIAGSPSFPPEDRSTCSGGMDRFRFALTGATQSLGPNATVGFVRDSSGLPGGINLYDAGPPAQQVSILAGNQIGTFGPGALQVAGFGERRAAANVGSRTLGPGGGGGGGGGGGTASTPGRVLGHGELPELLSATGGVPATTFTAAATATRPDVGPCAISLAGSAAGTITAGFGSFVATDDPRIPGGTSCNGPPASLRFKVLSIVPSGTSYVATVEVIQSDSAGAPVGTVGTITASQPPSGDTLTFAIGAHSGGFTMAPGHTGGFIDTWADVTLQTTPNALRVAMTEGAGTSVDVIGRPSRPCTVASAVTRVVRADNSIVAFGGGNLQNEGSCNGPPPARFAFEAVSLVTNGTTTATQSLRITQTTTPNAPVGTSGTITLIEDENGQGSKVGAAFGPYTGGWGPGHVLFNGFLDERAVANVSSSDLTLLPGADPDVGDARKSPRVDLDNVRVRDAKPDELKGKVKFEDRALGLKFRSSQVTSLVIAGTHATVRGFAILEGPGGSQQPVFFRIDVDDDGKKVDDLSIRLSNGYERAGAVVKGDFQVRSS